MSGGRISRSLGEQLDRDLVVSVYIEGSNHGKCHWPVCFAVRQQMQHRRPMDNLPNLQRCGIIVKRYVKFGSSEILISAGIRLFMEGAFEAVSEFGAIMEEFNARWPSSFGLSQAWRLWVFPGHNRVRGSSRGHDSIISELVVRLD